MVDMVVNVSYDEGGMVKHALLKTYGDNYELYYHELSGTHSYMRFICKVREEDIKVIIELLNAPVKSIDKEQLLKL